MAKPFYTLLLVLLSLFNGLLVNQAIAVEPAFNEHYYLTELDDPDFRYPQEDRSDWRKLPFAGIPITQKQYWVQVDFTIPEGPEPSFAPQPIGVFIALMGSYEAYWDGRPIGLNGVPGNSIESEQPGQIEQVYLLPEDGLAAGRHTLSLRVSGHHNTSTASYGMFLAFIDDYQELSSLSFARATFPLVMSGGLLLISVYCLFIYFTTFNDRRYLFFSALCAAVLSLFIAESWRGLWGYTYDWHIFRLEVVLWLTAAIGLLLVQYFAEFFHTHDKTKWRWLGLAAAVLACVMLFFDGYDERSLYLFLAAAGVSTAICLVAAIKHKRHARLMLIGLLLCVAPMIVNARLFMEQYFFLSFLALMLLMLFTLSKAMQTKQQELAQTKLNAARLELELVKRNLQPHFILNTLTAVEEWIEQSPAKAIQFIQALADEFRAMAKLSATASVPLKQEIGLCEAHLKVMGFRTNIEFSLTQDGVIGETQLPPGVLLTVVENALSHNKYRSGQIRFTLSQIQQQERTRLSLTGPLRQGGGDKGSLNTGTGGKYISARLTERFGDDWTMKESRRDAQWLVDIDIPFCCSEENV